MAVDESALALRALRAADLGSLLVAPGADWSDAYDDPLVLFDQEAVATSQDSQQIDTRGWGYMLLDVLPNWDVSSGLACFLQVFNAVGGATETLVFSMPMNVTNNRLNYVVPVPGDYHFVRITSPAADTSAFLRVLARRIPPGVPITPVYPTQQLALSSEFTAANTALGNYKNPLAPFARVSLAIEGGFDESQFVFIEGQPIDAQGGDEPRRLSASHDTSESISAIFNTINGMSFRLRMTSTTATYTATIDIQPMFSG